MPITVDASLKRQTILGNIVKALRPRTAPIRSFANAISTEPVQLNGTSVVTVPYIPLIAAASTDFAGSYTAGAAVSNSSKSITINKRKFRTLDYTSADLRDQPNLTTEELFEQNVWALIRDVATDVASMVTLANFGAAGYTGAGSGLNPAAVATLRKACTNAEWPEEGRTLVLNPDYDTTLIQEPGIINAMNYGGQGAMATGRVPNVLGFNYTGMGSSVPGNAENLVGWACLRSAGGVAFAPVVPTPAVQAQLIAYQEFRTDDNDFLFTYREWGDATTDKTFRVIECAYGYGVIEPAALKRIVSA